MSKDSDHKKPGKHKAKGVLRELERKYAFADLKQAQEKLGDPNLDLRQCYREVFKRAAANRQDFPELSATFSRAKRTRLYFADAHYALVGEKWEIRLQLETNDLMIKHGNGADEDHHTLDREETKINMRKPAIGSIRDIAANSIDGTKAPRGLRDLFGEDDGKDTLYPVVEIESGRCKMLYFRQRKLNGRTYFIEFEFAQDEGQAKPLGGNNYDIDQLELEVRQVMDAQTGIDVLKSPELVDMTLEELKTQLLEPALNEEEQLLTERFGVTSVFESKPREGFKRAQEYMKTEAGRTAAIAARERHLTTTIWSTMIKDQEPV